MIPFLFSHTLKNRQNVTQFQCFVAKVIILGFQFLKLYLHNTIYQFLFKKSCAPD